jgi:peptidoglycan hydrolase CwlO-like protein
MRANYVTFKEYEDVKNLLDTEKRKFEQSKKELKERKKEIKELKSQMDRQD